MIKEESEHGTAARHDRSSAAPDTHPTLEQLSDYRGGALEQDAEAMLREHLVSCSGCAALLLELESFSTPDPATHEASWGASKEIVWQQLAARLPSSGALRPRLVDALRSLAWLGSQPALRAMATAMLVVLVGLGFGLGWLAKSTANSERVAAVPQLYVPGVNLFPQGFERSSSEEARLRLPAGIDLFTVTLNLLDEPIHAAYRLRILDATGNEVWAGTGLQKTAIGNFSIALSRTLLPPGAYRLEVVGIDPQGEEAQVGDFALEIEHGP